MMLVTVELIQTIVLVVLCWFVIAKPFGSSMRQPARSKRKIILDSCALIDGRIIGVVSNGFITDELVIPQFIIAELQLLADGNDGHKRERARFGLDVAHQLQDGARVPVIIDRTELNVTTAVTTDDKLVALAKKIGGTLYTTDFNLGKVAAVEGVSIMNVNELAQNLRPITLPGEQLRIKIIQKGSNHGQGVGYLDDGTMIVVDGAENLVGRSVPVTVTRMHQTVAGKMVFGRVGKNGEQNGHTSAPTPSNKQEKQMVAPHRSRPQTRLYNRLSGRRGVTGRDPRYLKTQ